MPKQTILIVDDNEMNRAILTSMLEETFDIIEAEGGEEALSLMTNNEDISLVLLDIVMPDLNGLDVLERFLATDKAGTLPVIMVSVDTAKETVDEAYRLGATDFIGRPFIMPIVKRRIANVLSSFDRNKELEKTIRDQAMQRVDSMRTMVMLLSQIMESKNGESKHHVRNVSTITEVVLKELVQEGICDYSEEEIDLISLAAAFHDIGKMWIPSEILNKPGKLTDEEFKVMESHTEIGERMVKDIAEDVSEEYAHEFLERVAEICVGHHEKYDGRGYPHGLSGDDIPMSAQAVSLADVYDALTSERSYKKAFSHEQAIQMIENGECGSFSPVILDVLSKVKDKMKDAKHVSAMTEPTIAHEVPKVDTKEQRIASLLEHERVRHDYFARLSGEVQFDYDFASDSLTINDNSEYGLSLPDTIHQPLQSEALREVFKESIEETIDRLKGVTPNHPDIESNLVIERNGDKRWFNLKMTALFDDGDKVVRLLGKLTDIHIDMQKMESLKKQAMHDSLTGLLNRASFEEKISETIGDDFNKCLFVFDLDDFKTLNDTEGHLYGDMVLQTFAKILKSAYRRTDLIARVGGDEFAAYIESNKDLTAPIERIRSTVSARMEEHGLSCSIGVSYKEGPAAYRDMFSEADAAMYEEKEGKKSDD